jgi:hypothetical protein
MRSKRIVGLLPSDVSKRRERIRLARPIGIESRRGAKANESLVRASDIAIEREKVERSGTHRSPVNGGA